MTIDGLTLKVAGNKDLSKDLVDLRIRHDLNATSICTLRVLDVDRDLSEFFLGKLGTDVDVSYDGVSCFKGLLVEVGSEQQAGAGSQMLLRCMDTTYALSHQAHFRSFENQTYTDVVKKLLTNAGITGPKLASELNKFAPPYLLQEGTSMALITDICLRTGTRWHMRDDVFHVASKPVKTHKLVSSDKPDAKTLQVQSLTATYTAAPHAKGVEVRGWDHATTAEVVQKVPWPKEKKNGLADLAASGAGMMVKEPMVLAAAAAGSTEEAKALATSVAARAAAESTRVNCVLVDPAPALMVDDAVDIAGYGKLSGTYTLTRVEHRFGNGRRWETSIWAGYRPPTVLGAASAGHNEVLARRNQLDVGVVSDINDKSGSTRVKVSYPSRHGDFISAWARILGAGAGAKRGMHWIPEVGDEVIVGYLGGDSRFPVVIGGLWKPDDGSAPAAKADAIKDGSVVTRSMTTRLGSTLEFSDGTSDETKHIRLGVTSSNKPELRLGADRADLVLDDGKPLTIKAGATTIEITDKGVINITGKSVNIKADQDVKIEGTKVTIKGTSGVDVDGGGSKVGLKSGQASLESAGSTAVKGMKVDLN